MNGSRTCLSADRSWANTSWSHLQCRDKPQHLCVGNKVVGDGPPALVNAFGPVHTFHELFRVEIFSRRAIQDVEKAVAICRHDQFARLVLELCVTSTGVCTAS